MKAHQVLILICVTLAVSNAIKNSKFRWKRPKYAMPWLKGANVCAIEEVPGSRRRYYSECMAYMPRTVCGKQTFLRYHCCTGFEKVDKSDNSCNGVVPVENLNETLKNLYLTDFRERAKSSEVNELYGGEHDPAKAFTIFAPHNRAFSSLSQDKRKELVDRAAADGLVRYHTVSERFYLREFHNNMILSTLSEEEPSIRMNRYSNGIITANCARIVIPDQLSTNGIIHTTEKIVEPFQDGWNIMEALTDNKEHQFSELTTALIVTELETLLRDKNSRITLFAPTDTAFRNAPQSIINKILNDKDLLEKLLKYHMVSLEICSAAILNPVRMRTLEGQRVNLTCDVNNLMRINDIPIESGDIVTSNGVIHVVNEILIPDEVKSLHMVLESFHMYEFLEYAQQAGVQDILSGRDEGNYTVFVPSLDTFEGNLTWSEAMTRQERRGLQSQPAEVRRVFKYHIIPERITTNTIVGERSLLSLSGGTDMLTLKVQQGGSISVNDAKIISGNHEAQNGVVHIIDRIMRPPIIDSVETLVESTFLRMLETAGMTSLLSEAHGNYTLFAPTNQAFEEFSSRKSQSLMEDTEQLKKFLQYHIVKHPIYINHQKRGLQYRYLTLNGDWLRMRRDHKDEDESLDEESVYENPLDEELDVVVDGHANIIGNVIRAANGIVYTLDAVLECACLDDI